MTLGTEFMRYENKANEAVGYFRGFGEQTTRSSSIQRRRHTIADCNGRVPYRLPKGGALQARRGNKQPTGAWAKFAATTSGTGAWFTAMPR